MNSKAKFIYGCLLILLFSCLTFDIVLDHSFSYLSIAYFITFIVLSLFLIIRGFTYKIDTNLFFGILLTISPAIQFLIYKDVTNYKYYCIMVFAIMSLASLITWLYFKDKTHKLLFLIGLGEIAIFFLSFYLTKITIWYLIIMASSWIVIALVISFILRKKLAKR